MGTFKIENLLKTIEFLSNSTNKTPISIMMKYFIVAG